MLQKRDFIALYLVFSAKNLVVVFFFFLFCFFIVFSTFDIKMQLFCFKTIFENVKKKSLRSGVGGGVRQGRSDYSKHNFYFSPNISSFYIRNFKPLASFCGCEGRFESYLVENTEDRFSCDEAKLCKYVRFPCFQRITFPDSIVSVSL